VTMSAGGEGQPSTVSPVAPDLVGRIIGALAFGVALGTGVLAVVTWGIRLLQGSNLAIATPQRGFTAGLLPVLLIGTLGAMVAAGISTWTLLEPIGNPWRKAMLGIIAGSGSFVVALVTWPVERAFGRSGLLVLAALALSICVLVGWKLSGGGRRRAPRT
jgi:hypothetical protein